MLVFLEIDKCPGVIKKTPHIFPDPKGSGNYFMGFMVEPRKNGLVTSDSPEIICPPASDKLIKENGCFDCIILKSGLCLPQVILINGIETIVPLKAPTEISNSPY